MIEARVFGRVCRPWPSAQLLLQRARDERALVLLAEDLGDGFGRDLLVDAARQKLANDAQASPALGLDRRARVGLREPLIVEAAGFEEVFDGRVDGVVGVLTGAQAIAAFGDGVGATRQEMEGVEIGGGPVSSPNRMMSGWTPPCLAISSRAISAVVAMPWTLSLNSSRFDAHRIASSSVTNPCW